jgi:transposase
VSMTNSTNRVEIITSVQRRRRWTAPEKVRMVEETFEPGMTVSLVARRHGVAPNQLFTWRRLVAQGSLTAAGSGEEVVPASDYRTLQNQVRELHRLLGKKSLEAEILKEALEQMRVHHCHPVRVRSPRARSQLAVCQVLCSEVPKERPTSHTAAASVPEPMPCRC